MTAHHLHFKAHVGTTYKRALTRFYRVRDRAIPDDPSFYTLIAPTDRWMFFTSGERLMRKPRDYDAELVALDAKARDLRARKLAALGELVIATGADALPIDALAGALLMVAAAKDAAQREGWRERGAAFFRRGAGGAAGKAGRLNRSGSSDSDRAAPVAGDAGAS